MRDTGVQLLEHATLPARIFLYLRHGIVPTPSASSAMVAGSGTGVTALAKDPPVP